MRRRTGAVGRHPLRAADVLRAVGVTLPTGRTIEDDLLRTACDHCGLDQNLSGALLLVTGHPSPVPVSEPGRHLFGDFVVQPMARSGLRMVPPGVRSS